MNKLRLFIILIFETILFKQLESSLISNNNIWNIILTEYARNHYKWENQLPDFTSIILNEKLVQAVNSQQQLTNVQSLYNEAISKMYDQIPLQDLVVQLWKIYKKYDVESFITMTRAQLALFWRYRLDKIEDPYYVLLATHCFYKIKNDVFFSRLNKYTQHLMNISIKNAPLSLQYLFGKQEFCLCNLNSSEIIYQVRDDNKINKQFNQVLSLPWNMYNNMGLMQSIFEETEEDNLTDVNLALVNKQTWGYFHRLPDHNNIVGVNVTNGQLENFLWSVELVDDHQLVFEQDDYLLCRNGSVVYGSKQKTIYDLECQWRAEDCYNFNGTKAVNYMFV